MPRFSTLFKALDSSRFLDVAASATSSDVERILAQGRAKSLDDFARLISIALEAHLESMCHLSQALTQKHFGKAMRMFAPLYLSNECVNVCRYSGFSRHNDIPRITLSLEEVGLVVVKRIREALSPSEKGDTILQDGDSLEIVKIVAGG